MLDAALAYAALGIPVFPLVPRSKEPATAHGFKDATTDAALIREAWGAHPDCNVGGRMGGGIVCIDLDVDEAYDAREWLADWEAEHGRLPETATAVTGREGVHLFYRVGREVRPSANGELHVDVRGDGSYVVMAPSVHPNGRAYYWDLDPEDVGIADADANVYALIDAVRPGRADRERPTVREVREGEGRNDYLYRLGCSLRGQGLGDDAVEAALSSTNAASCVPPLGKAELSKIVRSVCSHEPGMSDEAKATVATNGDKPKPKPFDHVRVADEMLADRCACYIDGAPAVWDGMRYRVGWDALDLAIIKAAPRSKMKDRSEVRDYLRLVMPHEKAAPEKYIAFDNGVLDVETGDLLAPTPSLRIPSVIPHSWRPFAQSDYLDQTLTRLACGDPSVEMNLCEVLGLCMMRSAKYGYAAVLLGKQGDNASNGKSTYIKLLANVLGDENYVAMDLETIGEKYQAAQLMGKLANLGDDISSNFKRSLGLSIVKKVITGDAIYSDVKNKPGVTFATTCTLVLSANRFPNMEDADDGIMRRLHPIRFNAKFSPSDPDYDPDVSKKLAQEEVVEAAIKRGVAGLRRVMRNNGLTPNDESVKIVGQIRVDNSSLLQWMDDRGYTRESLVGWTAGTAYEDYRRWCEDSGVRHPFTKHNFGREVSDKLNLEARSVYDVEMGRTARRYFQRE